MLNTGFWLILAVQTAYLTLIPDHGLADKMYVQWVTFLFAHKKEFGEFPFSLVELLL